MTEMLQKTENVANNVANKNSQDLTEKWVNIYKSKKHGSYWTGTFCYKTKEEAVKDLADKENYLTTVNIEDKRRTDDDDLPYYNHWRPVAVINQDGEKIRDLTREEQLQWLKQQKEREK